MVPASQVLRVFSRVRVQTAVTNLKSVDPLLYSFDLVLICIEKFCFSRTLKVVEVLIVFGTPIPSFWLFLARQPIRGALLNGLNNIYALSY